jgi:N-acyl-D-aspartate/D-glutamate deacylase
VVATAVGGTVVYRNGQFRDGYGKTLKSGRFLRAGVNQARLAKTPV